MPASAAAFRGCLPVIVGALDEVRGGTVFLSSESGRN